MFYEPWPYGSYTLDNRSFFFKVVIFGFQLFYFELPKGSFATACISELIDLSVTENDEDSVE